MLGTMGKQKLNTIEKRFYITEINLVSNCFSRFVINGDRQFTRRIEQTVGRRNGVVFLRTLRNPATSTWKRKERKTRELKEIRERTQYYLRLREEGSALNNLWRDLRRLSID